MNFHSIQFRLKISSELYQEYYRGVAREVIATALDGRTVQFPLTALQPFVTHEGVHGLFEMEYDDNNRFIALRRMMD